VRRSSSSRGFSLIEVLFALAVVGLALGATAGLFGNFGVGHAAADDADHAVTLAEDTLAEGGAAAPLAPGVRTGRDGRFSWQLAVTPFADNDTPQNFSLYRLEARVAWRDGLRERRLSLSTVRLAPAPPP
jgi:general secretion pathway protein I